MKPFDQEQMPPYPLYCRLCHINGNPYDIWDWDKHKEEFHPKKKRKVVSKLD